MDSATRLAQKLSTVPDKPGVYLMKDSGGRIIYVGKAKVLRNRLRSYFQSVDQKDPKTRLLIRHIADFDFLIVENEKEALITENNLIKKHAPRYNVRLKDDKSYLCVKLTVQEDFPRIYLVRKILKDQARYFGPYSSSSALRESLAVLNRYFPLRKCSDSQFASRKRPCLMYQIGRCSGPCTGLIDRDEYGLLVKEVLLFLESRNRELVKRLSRKMDSLAQELNYEEAAKIRDQISAIESTLEKQKAVDASMVDQDVVSFYREDDQAEVAVLFIRRGKIIGVRSTRLDQLELPDEEIVAGFIKQYYNSGTFIPTEIIIPLDFEDRREFEELLRDLKTKPVKILVPQRGDRMRLLGMAQKNALAHFRSRSQRKDDVANTIAQLQQRLHLAEPPAVIDCFDISNLGGTLTVGSKIRFRDGKPDKSGYRRFRIKQAAEFDDYAAMYEVLTRWVKRIRNSGNFPDLVLIDGGKGQLAMAERAFHELDYISSALASISKPRELEKTDKIYIPGRKNPVALKIGSSGLLYLQRIRDEAHRFAIEYNRNLRQKQSRKSLLDDIPGIGDKRRNLLLRHFGSLKKLRQASLEQIMATPGIPESTAKSIYSFLQTPQRK